MPVREDLFNLLRAMASEHGSEVAMSDAMSSSTDSLNGAQSIMRRLLSEQVSALPEMPLPQANAV